MRAKDNTFKSIVKWKRLEISTHKLKFFLIYWDISRSYSQAKLRKYFLQVSIFYIILLNIIIIYHFLSQQGDFLLLYPILYGYKKNIFKKKKLF